MVHRPAYAILMLAHRRASFAASHCLLAIFAVLTVGAASSLAVAADVWVVTDRAHPVRTVAGARMSELDAPTRLEAALSADLPADPREAAARVQERLAADHGTLTQQLSAAYQAVTDAWSAGVTRIPAIVVDRRYVVYGDTDVAHALARIQTYREAHP